MRRITEIACWPEAEAQLLNGTPVKEVARFIQEDKGELVEIKPTSLQRWLYRWKSNLPIPQSLPTTYVQKQCDELRVGVDALLEMKKLIVIQLERVEMGRNLERQIGLLLSDVGTTQAQAFSQLRTYIAALQSLGMTLQAPEKAIIGGMFAYGGIDEKFLTDRYNNLDTEDLVTLMRLERKISA